MMRALREPAGLRPKCVDLEAFWAHFESLVTVRHENSVLFLMWLNA